MEPYGWKGRQSVLPVQIGMRTHASWGGWVFSGGTLGWIRRFRGVSGETGENLPRSSAGDSPTASGVREPRGSLADDEEKRQRLEAVLFLSRWPVPGRRLAQMAGLADATEARTLVRQLNAIYVARGRAFRVEEIAGGFQLLTRPVVAPWLRRLGHVPKTIQLTQPALETIAIVAYRQPVLRADIESIRGVSCGEILRQLMERDLVRISGRSEELGRPYLYSTTKHFLQIFGLRDADALPALSTTENEVFIPSIDHQAVEGTPEEDSDVSTAVVKNFSDTDDFLKPSVPHGMIQLSPGSIFPAVAIDEEEDEDFLEDDEEEDEEDDFEDDADDDEDWDDDEDDLDDDDDDDEDADWEEVEEDEEWDEEEVEEADGDEAEELDDEEEGDDEEETEDWDDDDDDDLDDEEEDDDEEWD